MNIAYGLYVSTNLRPCFTNQNNVRNLLLVNITLQKTSPSVGGGVAGGGGAAVARLRSTPAAALCGRIGRPRMLPSSAQ